MSEEWRPVPFAPGYEVSNHGRVRRAYKKRPGQHRYLTPVRNKWGYWRVKLGRQHHWYVHRLVALAFIGEPGDLTVDHIDFDTSNNHLSNLRYLTLAANAARHAPWERERMYA